MLYKYCNTSTSRIVLQASTLRWSTPRLFNDPFDVQFDLLLDVDFERVAGGAIEYLMQRAFDDRSVSSNNRLGQLLGVLRKPLDPRMRDSFRSSMTEGINESIEVLKKEYPKFNKFLRDELDNSKILCLSAVNDSIPMWSHYAESHRGLVLGFGEAAGIDSPWRLARPINYVEKIPKLYDEEFWSRFFSGEGEPTAEELVDRMLYTKHVSWSYEREHRLVAGTGRDPSAPFEDVAFHPGELRQVILGCNVDGSLREFAVSILKERYPHAALFEATKTTSGFELQIRKL